MSEDDNVLEQRIRNKLDQQGIAYEAVAHEPVYTNPAMAEALGVDEAATVKSLVLMTRTGDMIVFVLPGDMKAEWKRVSNAAGSRVSFADKDEVARRVGCEVGCVPPFGHMEDLPVYMHPDVKELEFMYFNPGVHDMSYKVGTKDLINMCNPTFI
ncbi:MAG: aminoacyl-tRNA deacylase [Desulfatibacillaceae bacterium]